MYSLNLHQNTAKCLRSQRIRRWGSESQITELNGLKIAVTTAMTSEQLDAYVLCIQIKEIGQKLGADDQQEPLHCLIRADTQEKVNHAKKLVHKVIEAATSAPESQNQRKRDQLRQLAVMNGTFRNDEQQTCDNCGQTGHRHYFCTMPPRFVAGVARHYCKNVGNIARDCPQKGTGLKKLPPWRKDRMARQPEATDRDVEFEQLMLEIGK